MKLIQVLSSVEPGYLQNLLPMGVPEKCEKWKDVMSDLIDKILPRITHWQSNNFHAYYPSRSKYQINNRRCWRIIGDMIANGFGTVSFSWVSSKSSELSIAIHSINAISFQICSPAVTEFEIIVIDWLARLLDLPLIFLNSFGKSGGGYLQGTASESMLVVQCGSEIRLKLLVHSLHSFKT